jgi:hypothetical protein
MTFKDYVNEAVKKMSDEKIDSFITKEWEGEATTFFYDAEAVIEIAAVLKQDDVIVSKDQKFFYIPADLDTRVNNLVRKIILKHRVKEAMNES